MVKKKKVLIVCYACEPNRSSEPGVGWHFSKEISKYYDVTVLTRRNNKEVIESSGEETNIDFLYCDLAGVLMKLKNKIPFGVQIYYYLWQLKAYFQIRQLFKTNSEFALVHHLTFGVSFNVPPAFLINKPFIWGPIGGGDFIPFHFLKKMGGAMMLQETIYFLLNKLSLISPSALITRKKAKAIVLRTSSVYNLFREKHLKKLFLISETAHPDTTILNQPKNIHNEVMLICVGRLMPHKGFMYALKGFHEYLRLGGYGKLIFLGDGPLQSKLQNYVKKYQLDGQVEFKGFVTSAVVKEHLEESDILLHPSFRDGGSWSIMEAMAHGLPVICFDTSGPKGMVSEQCGFRIPLSNSKQVAQDIGKSILFLRNNEKVYNDMSINCIARIKQFYNWNYRGEEIKKVYELVLDNKING
ncbi:hypothetical protein LCGC14_0119170 [marine sediment metagenome]|uniref:Glycosyl transferase family 1 domain-containing protein n=1 Tax=marine sediment metagenome TaxID=412755 RepID=A0A0F9Y9G6_9ZZZZ|nr:glycosyltransferase [Maribacter sp.]HDZ07421.1 glycosyltransferase [Maribacter sp.]HEA79886.1 glycosyltransferase [Maribacter sp.]